MMFSATRWQMEGLEAWKYLSVQWSTCNQYSRQLYKHSHGMDHRGIYRINTVLSASAGADAGHSVPKKHNQDLAKSTAGNSLFFSRSKPVTTNRPSLHYSICESRCLSPRISSPSPTSPPPPFVVHDRSRLGNLNSCALPSWLPDAGGRPAQANCRPGSRGSGGARNVRHVRYHRAPA